MRQPPTRSRHRRRSSPRVERSVDDRRSAGEKPRTYVIEIQFALQRPAFQRVPWGPCSRASSAVVYWICRGARPTPPILACAPVHTWCTHGVSIKYNIYSCWGISDHTALPMRAAVHMQRKLRIQRRRRCGAPARCGENFTSRGVVDAGRRPDAGRKWVVRGYRARSDPQTVAYASFEATVPVATPRPLRMRRVRGYRARIVGSAGRTWVVRGYRARIDPAV
jgi:hypothetical protein